MGYLSVAEIAKKWNVSERSVRNYCANGRVPGAFLTGKTWNLPEDAIKPERTNQKKEQPHTLLDILKEQKASKYSGGIYHKTQIDWLSPLFARAELFMCMEKGREEHCLMLFLL